MVSIIVPSRNETYLIKTLHDLLSKARGEIEILCCLDGYWGLPGETLPSDPRVHYLHRGKAAGMRENINAAAAIAKGQYLLKCDAHTLWAEGYDVALVEACADDWVMIPRRYALDPEAWAFDESQPSKYPIDYHYLSYPFERPDDPTCGLHGTEWRARKRQRADILIDDEMSSQGSAYFMSMRHWRERIGQMDQQLYGPFVSEFQEIGLRTWLGGGAVKVHKGTYYAHLFKGRKHGRGYSLGPSQFSQGPAVTDFWMNDRWAARVHDLRWLVEKFSPVPGWPADLDQAFYEAKRRAA
jgi:glycosyltransferase involved in cell wall biosynthesis